MVLLPAAASVPSCLLLLSQSSLSLDNIISVYRDLFTCLFPIFIPVYSPVFFHVCASCYTGIQWFVFKRPLAFNSSLEKLSSHFFFYYIWPLSGILKREQVFSSFRDPSFYPSFNIFPFCSSGSAPHLPSPSSQYVDLVLQLDPVPRHN